MNTCKKRKPGEISYPLQEKIGDPDLFVGREKESKDFQSQSKHESRRNPVSGTFI
ncbi:MAG: hypothetical protein GY795_35685 [Desulfobacterales bacterium]|nr:hypothetical protein [Desulfobacterales bacterium]